MGREPARPDGLIDERLTGDRPKVLVTGGAGLVATYLTRQVPGDVDLELTWRTTPPLTRLSRDSGTGKSDTIASHRIELDRADDTMALIAAVAPDVVIHAAYSQDRRGDVVDASAHVAVACAANGVDLVHLSSDVVFSGEAAPYVEDDPVDPVTDYGRWKAEAEARVQAAVPDACVTRTSLVVSLDPPDRGTAWLLGAVRSGERPTLFRDEIRSPIRATDLAAAIWALVGLDRSARAGVWHLPGPEALSRLEIGRRVLVAAGLDPGLPRVGSLRDHPVPRPRDLTMRCRRNVPGSSPSAVP